MNTRETFNNFSSKFSDTFKDNLNYTRVQNILSLETLKNQDYRKLHHNLCKLMFDDVKFGNEIWVQIDEIYSFEDNSENSSNFVRVSLLNQNMLDYDQNMFNLLSSENEDHELARDIFRPYFLHFLIDVTKIDEKSKAFISNSENLGRWFYGAITDKDSDGYLMNGLLESSASPVEYESRHLIIKDRTLSSRILTGINYAYAVRAVADDDLDVDDYLNTVFNDTVFSTVRTYNVGNGNCIYLHGKNNKGPKRLLYDIGYNMGGHAPRYLVKSPYKKSMTAIRSMKPDCIILSHWDLDHIMGCTYAPQRLFHCTWIAPTCTDAKLGAKRLCKYLDYSDKLKLINRNPVTPRTDAFARLTDSITGSTISFWMGLGAHGGISAINGEGIIIEIENRLPTGKVPEKINCLMAGDVPYSSIPADVNLIKNKSIDYLVVPHHGSFMNFDVLRRTAKNANTCAIISAAGKRGLPNADHENELRDRDFRLEVTRGVSFYIDFSLLNLNDILLF